MAKIIFWKSAILFLLADA